MAVLLGFVPADAWAAGPPGAPARPHMRSSQMHKATREMQQMRTGGRRRHTITQKLLRKSERLQQKLKRGKEKAGLKRELSGLHAKDAAGKAIKEPSKAWQHAKKALKYAWKAGKWGGMKLFFAVTEAQHGWVMKQVFRGLNWYRRGKFVVAWLRGKTEQQIYHQQVADVGNSLAMAQQAVNAVGGRTSQLMQDTQVHVARLFEAAKRVDAIQAKDGHLEKGTYEMGMLLREATELKKTVQGSSEALHPSVWAAAEAVQAIEQRINSILSGKKQAKPSKAKQLRKVLGRGATPYGNGG